jgi:hypothetical protein
MHAMLRPAATGVLAVALLGVVGPADARDSLECFAEVPGMTARGVPATFHYEAGEATTVKRGPGRLGYQPRDVAFAHHVDGQVATAPVARAATSRSYWFTLSGSQLREVTEVDRRDAHGRLISAKYYTRIVHKHWEGARQIAIGRNRAYLYVLTNTDQLLRYRLKRKDGNTVARYDQVVGFGFGTIGTFEYTRTTTALGASIDVFLATDADTGALVEFAIPEDDPTSYSRRVLADTGWWDMRSAGRRASCLNPKNGDTYDAIVAVDITGAVRLWTDRDGTDGDGQDIVEWGVLKPSWKPMAYSD